MAEDDTSDDTPLDGEYLPNLKTFEYEGESIGPGRPRLYDTPEQFDESVHAYFDYCRRNDEPMTITGLALAMGFASLQTLYNYGTYPEFLESVNRAKLLIQYGYELRLHGPNAAGARFALTCIEGGVYWNDKRGLPSDDEAEQMTHEQRLAHLR